MELQIAINNHSTIPKYQQIVDSVIDEISNGNLTVGKRIPSINELSEDCYLSRDTVEKAYRKLKERKIIVSVRGKGYFTAQTQLISKTNVFFLVNKLSRYKMRLFEAFEKAMGENAIANLFIYHGNESVFINKIEKELGGYDYYVILPHFKNQYQRYSDFSDEIKNVIEKIPRNKLILLDKYLPQIQGEFINIYQDYKLDIYNSLNEGIEKISKYKKLSLVFPKVSEHPYPIEIIQGFKFFCIEHSFEFAIIDEIQDSTKINFKDCYITIKESDLVNLIKKTRAKGFILGKDIGIISYNDTPLKELMGITVISTDFELMGKTTAQMIQKNIKKKNKNLFKLLLRSSI